MESQQNILLLHQYVADYKFSEFHELSTKISEELENEDLLDLYLLRAQLKLLTTDETVLDDLLMADKMAGTPKLSCVYSFWQSKSPNRFVVFNKNPQSLNRFMKIAPQVDKLLYKFYGDEGFSMARQIQSEVLYYMGKIDESIELAKEQNEKSEGCIDKIMACYTLLRCYMAKGNSHLAEQCLLNIIKLTKDNWDHPTCFEVYQTVRDWANVTTGWSGDTPRYHYTPGGHVLPVLEDRSAAIVDGISQLGPTEEPFSVYAALTYGEPYALRSLFMEIYHAVDYFRMGNKASSENHFYQAYIISIASDVIMPFVEYGNQIVPLLQWILEKEKYSAEWVEKVIYLAEQYEESINAYRK